MIRPVTTSGSRLFVNHRLYAGLSSFYLEKTNTNHPVPQIYPRNKTSSVQAVLKPVRTGFTLKKPKKEHPGVKNNWKEVKEPSGNLDLYL